MLLDRARIAVTMPYGWQFQSRLFFARTRRVTRPAEIPSETSQVCAAGGPSRPACPVCGGRLIEIRGKLQCAACHTICETCCEGGRG